MTTANEVYEKLKGIPEEEIKKVVGTGYGRGVMDFADKKVTERTHSKGIHFINNDVRTILDIGGQDSKVINLDVDGNVVNFLMNDKCAAGTGRFLEVTSNILGSDITKIDEVTARGNNPVNISSMCTVFAESEIVSLLAQNVPTGEVAAGILKSIANKSTSMLSRGEIVDKVAFTGGLAKSSELVRMVSEIIGKEIFLAEDTQIIGALGAAVIGFGRR